MELKVNDAESVGVLIGETILELQKEVIIVTAYSSDNCPVMNAAATTASVVAFKKIRVPCASHAFNNILKALLRENCLKYLWDSVLYCSCDGTGMEGKPIGSDPLCSQATILPVAGGLSFHFLTWKGEWSCSFFRTTTIGM